MWIVMTFYRESRDWDTPLDDQSWTWTLFLTKWSALICILALLTYNMVKDAICVELCKHIKNIERA